MERLVVCPGCQRHVKAHDARCPFCSRSSAAGSRGVALFGAVVVGAGLSFAACGGQSAPADAGADSSVDADDGGMVVMYGPAPFDAAADADGGLLGAYGPPPPQDSGQD